MKKKVFILLLNLLMIFSFLNNVTLAENKNLMIEASYDTPVTIHKTPEFSDEITGDLIITNTMFSTKRDYAQECVITIKNNSVAPLKYYLTCNNAYDDIYMNFVKGGSKNDPLIIHAGETQEITLSVFMQNATKMLYQIPITAYIVEDEEKVETVSLISIACEQPKLNLNCSLINVDDSTLTHTYNLTNNSDTLTDLNIYIEDEAKEYAKLIPGVSNFELIKNGSLEFKVSPDLTKMKKNEKSLVTGTIILQSGSQIKELDISFDTKNQEITTITMGELALIQENNPYAKIKYDENTFSFTTRASGTEMNFTDITNKYYEEGNPEKDGVNTAEEFVEVIDTIINKETGMIDFTISDTMVCEEENIPVSVRIYSEIINKGNTSTSINNDPISLSYINNTLTSTSRISISTEDYVKYLSGVTDSINYLKIENVPSNLLESAYNLDENDEILLNITTSCTNAALNILDEYADIIGKIDLNNLNAADSITILNNLNAFNSFAQASDPLRMAGDLVGSISDVAGVAGNIFSTTTDLYKLYNVWSNPSPNITTSEKIEYTSLQLAKNINMYVGATLLSKAGVAIGSAIGDGPGAIIGYFAGHVMSGLLDYGLGKWIDYMDNNMYSTKITSTILGHQCTNAKKVTYNFYVPGYGNSSSKSTRSSISEYTNESIGLYDTGRMYNGSYVNSTQTNYTYSLNGIPVGTSQNGGLTEVSIVKIPTSNLKLGQTNTIIRDYDTNPGSHFVTADSEITLLYPSNAKISYIGSPSSLEDVRLQPDFVIYTENINASGDVILNESNSINVNLYNRGSKSGWVTIIVKLNETEMYREENYYMPAFSEKKVSFDWTPETYDNDFSVELINTTINIDERKNDNNFASKTIEARDRKIPVIDSIEPQKTISNTPIYLTANVSNTNDIKNVIFYLNNEIVQENVENGKINDTQIRYSSKVDKLEKGKHILKTEIEYFINEHETNTIDNFIEIEVFDDNLISFEIDETIKNPNFKLLHATSSEYFDAIYINLNNENNKYSFKQTHDMYINPDAYYLFISCDDGITYVKLSDLPEKIISLSDSKFIEFKLDNTINFTSFTLYSIKFADKSYSLFKEYPISTENKIYVPSGEYDFIFSYNYEDVDLNEYLYNIKVENENVLVDTDIKLKSFKFFLPDENFSNKNDIESFLVINGYNYYFSLKTFLNLEAKEILYIINNAYTLNNLESAANAFIAIKTSNSLYKIDILSENIPTTLTKKDLTEVSFVMEDLSECKIKRITLSESTNINYYFDTNKLLLPIGNYELFASYIRNNKTLNFKDNLEVISSEKTLEVKLPTITDAFIPITVTWPNIFKLGFLNEDYTNNPYLINKNEELLFKKGSYEFVFSLFNNENQDYHIDIATDIELVDEKVAVIIDNKFSGEIFYLNEYGHDNIFYGNDSFSITLNELYDKYNNELTDFDANNSEDYLQGYAKFTSTTNENESYTVPISGSSLYSLQGFIPNVDGTYNVSVSLSNAEYEEEKLTIVASAETGGTITPNGAIDVITGENVTFTITPNSGYKISDVIVDDNSVGIVETYTFSNIIENHTISAKFSKIPTSSNTSGGSSTSTIKPKISKNYGGEILVSEDGKTITITPYEEYIIKDVVINEKSFGSINTYTFDKASSKNIVNVIFEKTENTLQNKWQNNFEDVKETDWFYDAVKFVFEKGITSGVSETSYAPNSKVTRGQFITMLCRAYQINEMSGDNFSDCGNTWYTGYLAAAKQLGISNGVGNNKFAPEKEITREEMVTLIYNYLKSVNKINIETSEISFIDSESISDWAKPAVAFANNVGYINGKANNIFDPSGDATRAELAQIFFNIFN